MKFFAMVLFGACAVTTVFGADLTGFRLWTNGELKGYEKKLAAKVDKAKMGSEQFGALGNNAKAQISHREGNGEAEVHEMVEDFFVVQSGEATLVVGGQVVTPHQSAPNEVRGPSIKGGESKKLTAGDIVCIPAKMPHQLMVPDGKQFTYFVLKVTK